MNKALRFELLAESDVIVLDVAMATGEPGEEVCRLSKKWHVQIGEVQP